MVEFELIKPETLDVVAVFTKPGEIDSILKQIESKVVGIVYDPSTAKGRKEIASLGYKVAQSKTLLDGIGKDLVDEWKQKTKKVDQARKHARDFLDDLKERVLEPKVAWERAEEEREAREAAEKQYQADWDQAIIDNDMFDRIRELERKEQELERIKAEQEAAERARIEDENRRKAEAERIEREKRIAQEAREKAEREAAERLEQQRINEELRIAAEREKTKAEYERKLKAIEDERIRKEQEEALRAAKAKAEEERRVADKNHRKKINNEALQCFIDCGIDKETSKNVVVAIAAGRINHVSINY